MPSRTRAVAVVLALLGAAMSIGALLWPPRAPGLDCPPGAVTLGPDGVARCSASGTSLPGAAALTVGQRIDLNRASAEDLAAVPGISLAVGRAVVEARAAQGGFRSWAEVDEVEGVGPARLEALRQSCHLGATDAGM